MTRGYKSIYGVGCVVEVITGLVLDFGILSIYCHGCASASARYGGTHTRELEEWKAEHTDCNCSYHGSRGNTKAAVAEMLLELSVNR